jgi:hypothetical protein
MWENFMKVSPKEKMVPNWSEEVFRVTKVTTQKSKGLGNASFLYQIVRTNGDAVKGSYRREELQIIPTMESKWYGVTAGREHADELRRAGVITRYDEQAGEIVRDGTTWVEKEVARIPRARYGDLRYEQVLRRLEQYTKQGMNKTIALERLTQSLDSQRPANASSRLAIMAKD